MHILTAGKKEYLDFLRNLTPQALLLSIALLAGRNLQFSCCDFNNTKATLIFIIFLCMFLAAFWANSYLFIENYLTSTKKVSDYSKELSSNGNKGIKYLREILKFAYKNDKRIFYETVVVFIFLEFALVFVIWSGIVSATSVIKTLGLH